MKRLFAFLLCFILALPALTGCGAAQGDAAPQDNVPAEATPAEITPTALPPTPAATAVPTLAEGSHGADEAPFVRADSWFPEDAAPETPRDPALGYITSYECAQAEDERIGCFYIEPARLEAIRALPQDEKRIFNLVPLPGYAYDARYAHVLEALEANRSAMSIYYKAMAGELPAEDYDFDVDPDDYPLAKLSWYRDDFDKLPREWFELYEKGQEVMRLDSENTQKLASALTLEYDTAAAKELSKAGADVQVRKMTEVYDGKENVSYILFITATPEELWTLSETADGLYMLNLYEDDLYALYDTPVWPEG